MNKQMKQHLEAVVEAIIFDDAAAANDAFHNYLSLKTQSILVGETCEDEECDDKEDKKSDDESADKVDDKKSKKSDDKEDKKEDKKDEGDEE